MTTIYHGWTASIDRYDAAIAARQLVSLVGTQRAIKLIIAIEKLPELTWVEITRTINIMANAEEDKINCKEKENYE